MDSIKLVEEFHAAFEIATPTSPVVPEVDHLISQHLAAYGSRMKAMSEELMRAAAMNGKNTPLLRLQLIQEELSELAEAMARRDLVACLDALVDLRYVLDGTTLALGLQHHFADGVAEVHRSNMSKLVDGKPVKNEAGRVVKGENYSPPNLKSILEKAL